MTPALRLCPSPNADDRPLDAEIDTLLLHYTGMKSAKAAIERLTDPASTVSAHYLIDEDGAVVGMVGEARRAWHAGRSFWRGRERLNDGSIGIEIVNPGHEWGYRAFTETQYQALERLCPAIMRRWSIAQIRVLAHSDVAPDRKADPGELFDWRRLADAGIGVWPEEGEGRPRPLAAVQAALARVGYRVPIHGGEDEETRAVIIAFQRHFRPERVDGVPDRGTLRRLDGLLGLLPLA